MKYVWMQLKGKYSEMQQAYGVGFQLEQDWDDQKLSEVT
jgi:hypothetical protein